MFNLILIIVEVKSLEEEEEHYGPDFQLLDVTTVFVMFSTPDLKVKEIWRRNKRCDY